MSEAFEILSRALDEAIADAQNPTLERQIVAKEVVPPDKEDVQPQSQAC